MTDYTNYVLENKTDLTALANVIRSKTGTTNALTVPQMKTSIESIETGGGVDTCTLEVAFESLYDAYTFDGGTLYYSFHVYYSSQTEIGIKVIQSGYIDSSNSYNETFRFSVPCGTIVLIEGCYHNSYLYTETVNCEMESSLCAHNGEQYDYSIVGKITAEPGETASIRVIEPY